jgi:hypothetical protein
LEPFSFTSAKQVGDRRMLDTRIEALADKHVSSRPHLVLIEVDLIIKAHICHE